MTLQEQLQDALRRLLNLARPYIGRVRAQIDPYVAQARARYEKLEGRERILVQIGGAVLAIFLAYSLLISPVIGYVDGLDDRITQREHELVVAQRLAANYAALKVDLKEAQRNTVPNSKDFSLFSILEASFTKSIGRDKIASITPTADKKLPDGLVQYSVQLKLSDVSLAQVVDALYAVRTMSVPVGVSNLRIERRSPDTHSFDVDLTCVALGHNA